MAGFIYLIKMERYLVILIFISIGYIAAAQVQENMLMERFNMNAFNPAFVGSEGREVSFTTRSAWQGVLDAPRTNYFFYSGNPKKNLSLGGSVISNKVFIDTRTQYAVDASYKLEMDGTTNLFLGVKAGATNKNTDIDGLKRITQEANPAISSDGNAIFPVFGFGALLKSEKFYVSASIPNFLNPGKFVKDDSFIGSEKPVTYLLAGTSIDTGVFGSKLKPFISAKLIPDGQNQTHIGGTFDFKDTVEIGGGYKSTGYSNAILIVKTKFGLTAAYAYDFGVPNGQAAITRSGNEIFLKFRF
ncbi:PorP/SprF family type IX secretion system membrane protein [Flavobacteriaceae bacterium]|jgi:type IX secretion system PorP/SprF family membrane protein|nr:PorP/SprF family type IX secretion system membrane protein [Flavobacteriaceae bacterium]